MISKVAIFGLGYVGLPLAVASAKKFNVVGFDKNPIRIAELKNNLDRTGEISNDELIEVSSNLEFTSDVSDTCLADLFIVCVPTPVTNDRTPDLRLIAQASADIGEILTRDNIVVFESTVYPGVTEEVCVPILEKASGLRLGEFHVGYSPERINPGDNLHTISSVTKVVSASSLGALDRIDAFYSSFIPAGTFRASSIRVAEAAKVIENTQRDINIAFVNELSVILDAMEINVDCVLEAARTKWNFLDFRPGLVGGHCIGVDPYYLAHASKSVGINPEMVLAGRKINNSIPQFVSDKLLRMLQSQSVSKGSPRVLIAGITFKENCPDTRNSLVFEVIDILLDKGLEIVVFDPVADIKTEEISGGIFCASLDQITGFFDAIVITVPHVEIVDNAPILLQKLSDAGFVYDFKNALNPLLHAGHTIF